MENGVNETSFQMTVLGILNLAFDYAFSQLYQQSPEPHPEKERIFLSWPL